MTVLWEPSEGSKKAGDRVTSHRALHPAEKERFFFENEKLFGRGLEQGCGRQSLRIQGQSLAM